MAKFAEENKDSGIFRAKKLQKKVQSFAYERLKGKIERMQKNLREKVIEKY